ncbi:hypothetical protein BH09ACT9_BH09ACT9_00540 [soil metagenome]
MSAKKITYDSTFWRTQVNLGNRRVQLVGASGTSNLSFYGRIVRVYPNVIFVKFDGTDKPTRTHPDDLRPETR